MTRMKLTETEAGLYKCLLKKHIKEPVVINWSLEKSTEQLQRGTMTSDNLALCHITGNNTNGYKIGQFSRRVIDCMKLDLKKLADIGVISEDAYDLCCGLLNETDDDITLSFLRNTTKLPLIPTSKGIYINIVKDDFTKHELEQRNN